MNCQHCGHITLIAGGYCANCGKLLAPVNSSVLANHGVHFSPVKKNNGAKKVSFIILAVIFSVTILLATLRLGAKIQHDIDYPAYIEPSETPTPEQSYTYSFLDELNRENPGGWIISPVNPTTPISGYVANYLWLKGDSCNVSVYESQEFAQKAIEDALAINLNFQWIGTNPQTSQGIILSTAIPEANCTQSVLDLFPMTPVTQ